MVAGGWLGSAQGVGRCWRHLEEAGVCVHPPHHSTHLQRSNPIIYRTASDCRLQPRSDTDTDRKINTDSSTSLHSLKTNNSNTLYLIPR